MTDNFTSDVEQSAADCGGVSCHGNDTLTCILLEGFQEEEACQHRIVMGSVHAELFENIRYLIALAVFTYGFEQIFKLRINIDTIEIPHKGRKSCSACQCIVRDFDPVNSVACDILRFCDILHELPFTFWVVVS